MNSAMRAVVRYVAKNHLAVLALIFAVSGTAFAAVAANSVYSTSIVNGQVKTLDIATGAVTAGDLATNSVTTSKTSKRPSVRVYDIVGDGSIADGTATTLSWEAETYDTASLHSTVTNPSRLRAPVQGLYLVTANAQWSTSIVGYRQIILFVNGVRTTTELHQANGSADGYVYMSTSDMLVLDAGDYVEMKVTQSSGGALTLFGSSIDESSASLTWLSKS